MGRESPSGLHPPLLPPVVSHAYKGARLNVVPVQASSPDRHRSPCLNAVATRETHARFLRHTENKRDAGARERWIDSQTSDCLKYGAAPSNLDPPGTTGYLLSQPAATSGACSIRISFSPNSLSAMIPRSWLHFTSLSDSKMGRDSAVYLMLVM